MAHCLGAPPAEEQSVAFINACGKTSNFSGGPRYVGRTTDNGMGLIFVLASFCANDGMTIGDRVLLVGKSIIGRSGNSPELEMDIGFWEAMQSIPGVTGVIVVSVGLSYLLPILASVAHKRSIAATVHSLGDGVDDMCGLGSMPNGSSFGLHLVSLTAYIALAAERHRSYPVLHYFH